MKTGRYKWLLVALLWVVALLNYLDRQVIFAVFPLLKSELHVSSVELGFLGTSFLWVYGLLSPFGGYVADRFGRRRVILFSLGVWSAITWLTGHARGYHELLLARSGMGISEACYLPAALALVADFHDEKTRSRAIGLHQSGLYAGIALGGWGGGWMGEHYGWRMAFTVLGLAGLIYVFVLSGGLRDTKRVLDAGAAVPLGRAVRELTASRSFLCLVGVNSLASVAYWCVYTWLAIYLYERFRMSLTAAGFASTFYVQVASFAGILGGGWMADRWRRSQVRGRVLTQSIGLAVAAPFLFLVGSTDSRWVLLPCLLLFGLGRGFFDCNLMPVVCQIVSERLRATAYGVLNFTSCLAGGAMAVAGGALKDTIGLGGALQLSAAMLMIAALWLWTLRVSEAR
jgi:predicted MFS family arabinose efflux permease